MPGPLPTHTATPFTPPLGTPAVWARWTWIPGFKGRPPLKFELLFSLCKSAGPYKGCGAHAHQFFIRVTFGFKCLRAALNIVNGCLPFSIVTNIGASGNIFVKIIDVRGLVVFGTAMGEPLSHLTTSIPRTCLVVRAASSCFV